MELKDISSIHSLLEKLDLEAQVRRKEQKGECTNATLSFLVPRGLCAEEEERKEATTN